MHNKKLLAAAIATAGAAGMVLPLATPAMADPAPPKLAYGSVELGSPLQYETFLAVQNGRNHGTVDYTNWTYAETGSGVWAPTAGAHALVFTYQGTDYAHTLNDGLKLVAVSNDQLRFTGTGEYNAQAGATWTISGAVTNSRLSATIVYNGTLQPGYKLTLSGKVAADGSASGTAKSSSGQALTFTMPAGTFGSVLHYVAPVKSVQVKHSDATFQFTIPANVPGLAGTKISVKVHDGGRGPKHDTYAHGVTGSTLTSYPIIGGPGITVAGSH